VCRKLVFHITSGSRAALPTRISFPLVSINKTRTRTLYDSQSLLIVIFELINSAHVTHTHTHTHTHNGRDLMCNVNDDKSLKESIRSVYRFWKWFVAYYFSRGVFSLRVGECDRITNMPLQTTYRLCAGDWPVEQNEKNWYVRARQKNVIYSIAFRN